MILNYNYYILLITTFLLNTKLHSGPLYANQVTGGLLRTIYGELWGW